MLGRQQQSQRFFGLYKSNKQFKSDSARVAFLLCVGFCVLGGMQRLGYCVPHTLIGRYVAR
ncbi:DUF3265 domain-containing protein [Vibrio alginolyticus]|nr:DUF3265 domain-containing protein [Vibrio alginolyticus]